VRCQDDHCYASRKVPALALDLIEPPLYACVVGSVIDHQAVCPGYRLRSHNNSAIRSRASVVSAVGRVVCRSWNLHRACTQALARYVDSDTLPIVNNPVENAIRPIAIGKRNGLFTGYESVGRRAAAIRFVSRLLSWDVSRRAPTARSIRCFYFPTLLNTGTGYLCTDGAAGRTKLRPTTVLSYRNTVKEFSNFFQKKCFITEVLVSALAMKFLNRLSTTGKPYFESVETL
jgi:hypothetical protein